jgi:hypothetical protein
MGLIPLRTHFAFCFLLRAAMLADMRQLGDLGMRGKYAANTYR